MRILRIDLGPVPWDQLLQQPNIRFGTWELVRKLSVPWVVESLEKLREGFPADHHCDVRFWPHLEAGKVPGTKIGWHQDLTRKGGIHRLYSCGAGSITEFAESAAISGEGCAVEYDLDVHRARPATYSGPRLLLRITQPPIACPKNVIGLPSWHHTE